MVGRLSTLADGSVAVDFDLVNALTGAKLATQRFVGSTSALRNAAHRVSDVIYQKITGVRGAFATRIAYVAVDGTPPNQRYQLIVADADGANQHLVLESQLPAHVAGLVARRPVARLRVVRDQALGRLRAAGAHRRAAPGLGAGRGQRRTGLVA